MKITPWKWEISQGEIDDLHERLKRARFPDPSPGGDDIWTYDGTPTTFARKLRDYWLNEYDIREFQQKFNAFDQYMASGFPEEEFGKDLTVHFWHLKPPGGPVPTPETTLLLMHGWPGSVWEFHKTAPLLLSAGFTLVVPSLVGYGFSGKPTIKGFSARKIGQCFDYLMRHGLKYRKYVSNGGDWGSVILQHIAADESSGCIGAHFNMTPVTPPKPMKVEELSRDDILQLERAKKFNLEGVGYQKIQQTRPQTLGYGLNDSPLGLGCYIAEKFSAWSDTEGTYDPLKAVSMFDLTMGLGISARQPAGRISIPCGVAAFPHDIYNAPRSWIEAKYNLKHYKKMKTGGHFAALEKPEAFTADLVEFFTVVLPKTGKL